MSIVTHEIVHGTTNAAEIDFYEIQFYQSLDKNLMIYSIPFQSALIQSQQYTIYLKNQYIC